jgi:hypothetical protein
MDLSLIDFRSIFPDIKNQRGKYLLAKRSLGLEGNDETLANKPAPIRGNYRRNQIGNPTIEHRSAAPGRNSASIDRIGTRFDLLETLISGNQRISHMG